jgi:hypothetical protein
VEEYDPAVKDLVQVKTTKAWGIVIRLTGKYAVVGLLHGRAFLDGPDNPREVPYRPRELKLRAKGEQAELLSAVSVLLDVDPDLVRLDD